jgi:M6 family metalloprotease-like protein
MKKNRLFLFCGCVLMALQASAAPAITTPIRKVLPDGTEITVRLCGDEKIHWMETLDGYTLLYDSEQYLVYATTDAEGNMVPSAVRYGAGSSKGYSPAAGALVASLKKGLRYSPAQVALLRQIWQAPDHAAPAAAAPVIGTKKALCVLMEYPDKPLTKNRQDFDDLINQVGYTADGASASVRDFYLENSYGQMELVVTVAGPYQAAHNHREYGYTNGDGTTTFDGRDLAREAIQAAYNDGIDLRYFANDANRMETFHVIYAGHGKEASGNSADIWAHKWVMRAPMLFDGITVADYSCSPELRGGSGSNITRVGVICHELCHVFGSPDYYDTNSGTNGLFLGTGEWDLMASGMWNAEGDLSGSVPAHINMFQKIRYGWVTPVELTDRQEVTEMLNSAENPVAYILSANDDGEHYILENKQQRRFDAHIPGHGLLIYHVHPNAIDSEGSNERHPQQLYPVCATAPLAKPNADPQSYGSINSGGCTFPGTANKTYFTDASVPMSFSWATGEGIQSPISDIKETGGKISFGYRQKTPPEYTLTLNRGEATTSKSTVNLTFHFDGEAPVSYKATENESRMGNAVWVAYNPEATYSFEANTEGYKTVYTQLRNHIGVSGIQSAGIFYKSIVKANDEPSGAPAEWSVTVSPTAVENTLTVVLKNETPATVEAQVFSVGGALYLTQKISAPAATIDLSTCPAGLLLIRFSDGKKQVTQQVLKL